MQSFDEILQKELETPQNLVKIDPETGKKVVAGQIAPLEAMVKSIVAKAGKGDIAAINVIRNITRKTTAEDGAEAERREKRVAEFEQQLTDQFKGEKIYDGQVSEIRILAEQRYILDLLSRKMQSADFEPVLTEYTQSGGTKHTRNPIMDIYKEAKKQFDSYLDRLRSEAIQRSAMRDKMMMYR